VVETCCAARVLAWTSVVEILPVKRVVAPTIEKEDASRVKRGMVLLAAKLM
jgi:hypothetical protein